MLLAPRIFATQEALAKLAPRVVGSPTMHGRVVTVDSQPGTGHQLGFNQLGITVMLSHPYGPGAHCVIQVSHSALAHLPSDIGIPMHGHPAFSLPPWGARTTIHFQGGSTTSHHIATPNHILLIHLPSLGVPPLNACDPVAYAMACVQKRASVRTCNCCPVAWLGYHTVTPIKRSRATCHSDCGVAPHLPPHTAGPATLLLEGLTLPCQSVNLG